MLTPLISRTWALEAEFHNTMALLAVKRMEQGHEPFPPQLMGEKRAPYLVDVLALQEAGTPLAASAGYNRLAQVRQKSGQVVVIPIIGTMSRYGDMCAWGTEDYAHWVVDANNDPNISAIVLELNSPGGEVDGTEMLANVVKASGKPVVSYVAGMAASAAYWVASHSRKIVMESETASAVGSIGVLAMHVDAREWLKKEGYAVTIVRAAGSEDKALFNPYEPMSEAMLAEARAELTPIREAFVAAVQAARPGIAGDVFSGKMYNGQQALKKKMADRLGYLGDAIALADELARAA